MAIAGHSHHHRKPTRRLGVVLAITSAYTVAEAAGGWVSRSLALLADAGHMLTDNLALGLALLAAWSAQRPPSDVRTYGYQRLEILAALVNGVSLVVISLFIFWEAIARFREPPEIDVGLMAVVATGGLIVNIVGARMLHGHQYGLNVRAAYLHVLGDLLGSIGTLVAAACLAAFGWAWIDPLASLLIGGIIIFSSGRLVLDSVHVLLEGAPRGLKIDEVRRGLLETEGVCDVHDLHVWTLAGGSALLTAHLVCDHTRTSAEVLRLATAMLRERFSIEHTTLQVEPPDYNIVGSIGSGPGPGCC